jgi:hypothetical protein
MGRASRRKKEDRVIPDQRGWIQFDWRHCPIWQVTIGLAKAGVQAGEFMSAHPEALVAKAMIDTGTSHTFAVPAIFKRLGATPTGEKITTHGAEGHAAIEQDNYRLDLAVPYTDFSGRALLLPNYPVSEGSLAWGGHTPLYEVVFGCDLLRFCRFTIDGPTGLFKLERMTSGEAGQVPR